MVLKILGKVIGQQKDVKGIQIGKEEVKISLFADFMIVYLSDPKIPRENHKPDKQLQQSEWI
jgi:hypothetical protein